MEMMLRRDELPLGFRLDEVVGLTMIGDDEALILDTRTILALPGETRVTTSAWLHWTCSTKVQSSANSSGKFVSNSSTNSSATVLMDIDERLESSDDICSSSDRYPE